MYAAKRAGSIGVQTYLADSTWPTSTSWSSASTSAPP